MESEFKTYCTGYDDDGKPHEKLIFNVTKDQRLDDGAYWQVNAKDTLGFTVPCTGQGKDEFDCRYVNNMEFACIPIDAEYKWETHDQSIGEFTPCPVAVETLGLRCLS